MRIAAENRLFIKVKDKFESKKMKLSPGDWLEKVDQ